MFFTKAKYLLRLTWSHESTVEAHWQDRKRIESVLQIKLGTHKVAESERNKRVVSAISESWAYYKLLLNYLLSLISLRFVALFSPERRPSALVLRFGNKVAHGDRLPSLIVSTASPTRSQRSYCASILFRSHWERRAVVGMSDRGVRYTAGERFMRETHWEIHRHIYIGWKWPIHCVGLLGIYIYTSLSPNSETRDVTSVYAVWHGWIDGNGGSSGRVICRSGNFLSERHGDSDIYSWFIGL